MNKNSGKETITMVALTQLAGNYFLWPPGLIALSGLFPLIIFYLIRKKPEEQIMPAMMFFMKDKKSGTASRALQNLLRNLLLLLHILLVVGMAAAIAQPFIEAPSKADKAVVVMDISASMSDEMSEAKQFAAENLGSKNTLIMVGNDIEIAAEDSSAGKVRRRIEKTETQDVRTDIANAVELASDYSGEIVIASDLDQTESQKSTEQIIENLRNNGRTVKIFDSTEANSWGIIDVKPRRENSSVDIKNFENEERQIEVFKDGSRSTVKVAGGEVNTLNVKTDPGTTEVKLEKDGMESDNTAYISIPKNEKYRVLFISDSGNKYFEKAVELIEFTDIEVMNPPVQQEINADIYVVGKTNRILSETVNKIESDVDSGASMIVFSHPGVSDLGFESLPVRPGRSYSNATVKLQKPVKTEVETQVLKGEKQKGKAFGSPPNALVEASYGSGKVFYYNIHDRDFRTDFLYPVFWKHIFREMTDKPSIKDLNLETGETVNASNVKKPSGQKAEGEVEAKQAGFYNSSNGVYAANLESEDESYAETPDVSTEAGETSTERRNVQNLATLLLALLVIGELAYLYRLGELQ